MYSIEVRERRYVVYHVVFCPYFFFNDPATPEIYTLSLHDALPIWVEPEGDIAGLAGLQVDALEALERAARRAGKRRDRKSTRLNSSHVEISYAVFCLKKKKKRQVCSRRRG